MIELKLTDNQAQSLASILGSVGGSGSSRAEIQSLALELIERGFSPRQEDLRAMPQPSFLKNDREFPQGVWLKDRDNPEKDEVFYKQVLELFEGV